MASHALHGPSTTRRVRTPEAAGPAPVRRGLLLGAIAAAVVLGCIWFLLPGDQADRPRLLDREALAALPDAELEPRIVNDLAQRIAYAGYTDGRWRTFGEAAQHVYAVAAVEEEVLDFGFDRVAKAPAGDDRVPGLPDARDAYRAMGLEAAAAAVDLAIAGDGRAHRAYLAAVRDPQLVATRAAWIRGHLDDLAAP